MNDKSAIKIPEWIGSFNGFNLGLRAILKNWQFALFFTAVNVLGAAITNQHPEKLDGFVIYEVLLLFLTVAFTKYSLSTASGKVVPLSRLFSTSFVEFFTVVGAAIVFTAIFVLTVLGLFIPLIWIIPWTTFILYAVVDKHVGISQAFRRSKQLAHLNMTKVWGLLGVLFLYILGAMLLSVVIPVVGWAVYAAAASLVTLAIGTATARLYYYAKTAL